MESGFTIFRQRSVAYIRRLFRKFRFVTVNREIMVFLLFLIVAVGFWLAQTFKDHTTINLEYELRIINQPKNLIFTSDLPSNISASVSGRGFSIMQYLVKRRHKVLNVDYDLAGDSEVPANMGKDLASLNQLRAKMMEKYDATTYGVVELVDAATDN